MPVTLSHLTLVMFSAQASIFTRFMGQDPTTFEAWSVPNTYVQLDGTEAENVGVAMPDQFCEEIDATGSVSLKLDNYTQTT